ncbi:hypothetical protein AYO21_09151 [Fonsecaea monophora]|uniref:S-Me-THD N-terminal domain-containing protein n=1 Tax=Fonsecaea monophora TaxID=254056 RepID=A0A177EYK8_9EURO|nr:hypothetical protein AYO21_09151 [Fonsecaea monophora]OAG36676.1 hypothetical protein AYO21_09151 [Fonsecaea monophora]
MQSHSWETSLGPRSCDRLETSPRVAPPAVTVSNDSKDSSEDSLKDSKNNEDLRKVRTRSKAAVTHYKYITPKGFLTVWPIRFRALLDAVERRQRRPMDSEPTNHNHKNPRLPQRTPATAFDCHFCNARKAVKVKVDEKAGRGSLKCKNCHIKFACAVDNLSAAVDVHAACAPVPGSKTSGMVAHTYTCMEIVTEGQRLTGSWTYEKVPAATGRLVDDQAPGGTSAAYRAGVRHGAKASAPNARAVTPKATQQPATASGGGDRHVLFGGNGLVNLEVAAAHGVPCVDVDLMGRAYPTYWQTTTNVYGPPRARLSCLRPSPAGQIV